ncbi:phenoloxidase-activating factor 3-like [Leptidea sinapis]|uniref:phenoloxidase-activating factor 3-like n=1 Tax=Leptidea sinapis TaxID=189913 RepID=UPI0021435A60|nr:phenoloxidase-activating factor 3-like [Leptidea sinapis]
MLKLTWIVLLFHLYFLNCLVLPSHAACRVDSLDGLCKPIKSCRYAMKLLMNNDAVKLATMFCGHHNDTVKVCCPILNDERKLTKHRLSKRGILDNLQDNRIHFFEDTGRSIIQEEPSTERDLGANASQDNRIHFLEENSLTTRPEVHQSDKQRMSSITQRAIKNEVLPNLDECGKQITDNLESRIVNGDISEIGEFPWIVRLKLKRATSASVRYACAGTLITDRHVLTAAHCLVDGIQLVSVRLGEWDASMKKDCYLDTCSDTPIVRRFDNIMIYPDFNNETRYLGADIAIIRLDQPVTFTNYVRPVCLPTDPYVANKEFKKELEFKTAGWGLTENGVPSQIKRKTTLGFVPKRVCRNIISKYYKRQSSVDFWICAGGKNGTDTCAGDSGGPLLGRIEKDNRTNWYLYGVTSVGASRCGTERPTLYTRITKVMDWILDNIRTS